MEMNDNEYMPELHVAQQRRRDKLRVQQLQDLQHSNSNNDFHHDGNNNNNNSTMLYPPEMMNFSTSFTNIHPSRFVAPCSSGSCDPQPLQSCDDWVSGYVVDPGSRRNGQIAVHSNSNGTGNLASGAEVLAAHYYHSGNVHGWENGGNNELALLPSFVGQGNDASALSLSLSSNQICDMRELSEPRELKPFESGSISSGKNQIQDVVVGSSSHVYRNVGPLGPFTGYATILRGSKFLKPAQLLLDEFLTAAGLRHVRASEEVESVANTSNVLGQRLRGSDEMSNRSASGESYRPDCNEKKAKLLHMQEEVCKRHKQYHQQMEMVMSAFDSVPGLSNATPYISRSLKSISRHFRSIKNAIADQLRLIKRALGEDFSSPASYMKGDNSSSRFDISSAKMKTSAVGGSGYGSHQNHTWRPQRGLPERAVSVLRAWLFDHFLHPYPTDSDKQMLASQTGLSRNQVSNWFINARVRLWKPMVEEIHMLETKGTTGRSEPIANQRQVVSYKPGPKPTANAISVTRQIEAMGGSSSYMDRSRGESNTEQLFQKNSSIESQQISTTSCMDASWQRRGLELGGLGNVSLTLGLRHGSETTHHHHHQQQFQHQFQHHGMHFGGHVLHDFTG